MFVSQTCRTLNTRLQWLNSRMAPSEGLLLVNTLDLDLLSSCYHVTESGRVFVMKLTNN